MIKQLLGTFGIQAFGLLKIPLLAFICPRVEKLDDDVCAIRVPLNYRTKNHLGSMYFGVLAAGADLAGGFAVMQYIFEKGNKVNLVFKDFQANFYKRPEADVIFTFKDLAATRALVDKALLSGEREEMPMHIAATVPDKFGDEPVAEFVLTLSLKRKNS